MTRSRLRGGILAVAALLSIPSVVSTQLTGRRERRVALPGRRRRAHAVSHAEPDQRVEFRQAEGCLDLPGRQLRPGRRVHGARRRRSTSTACSTRSSVSGGRSWRSIADTGETRWTFREPDTMRYLRSPRTDFGKGVAYAEVDGRGVIFISTPAFFLWALDARTGRPLENWGTQGAAARLARQRGRRHDPGSGERLGSVAELEGREIRPGLRAAAAARHDHLFVAADRGERSRRRARRPRAELRPDPHRKRPGRHSGLRREDRKAPLEIPRHPAARRSRPRDLGERRVEVLGEHGVVGAGRRRPGARARLHRDERLDLPVLHGPSPGPQPVRRQRHRARRQDRPAADGTSRCTTASSGTTTSRPRRS